MAWILRLIFASASASERPLLKGIPTTETIEARIKTAADKFGEKAGDTAKRKIDDSTLGYNQPITGFSSTQRGGSVPGSPEEELMPPDKPAPDAIPVPDKPEMPAPPQTDFPEIPKPQPPQSPFPAHPEPTPGNAPTNPSAPSAED
jgi:hypothetical protein